MTSQKAVEVQFRGQHDLQNIVLARDLVMQYVYPLEGNEAVLGVDYRDLPGQLEAVEAGDSAGRNCFWPVPWSFCRAAGALLPEYRLLL